MSVVITCGDWTSPPIHPTGGFQARWKGLRPVADEAGLLLTGSSVHGVGMRVALWAVGIDEAGVVTGVRLLLPRRFVRLRGARAVLELPAALDPPPIGGALSIRSG